nr:MAG TPA: hypothetical protein [Caudoviricetes sp.]
MNPFYYIFLLYFRYHFRGNKYVTIVTTLERVRKKSATNPSQIRNREMQIRHI